MEAIHNKVNNVSTPKATGRRKMILCFKSDFICLGGMEADRALALEPGPTHIAAAMFTT